MHKKTSVTIISEHQSEAIKNITLLYTLFLVTDASKTLNINRSVNSFLKLHIPISNLKVK